MLDGDGSDTGAGGADIDVDALLGQIDESGNTEIPMEDPVPEPVAEQTPAPQQTEYFTLNVNGKEIKATREQALKWAQQGYDYPQKMQSFQKERQEFETKFKPYQEIDQFARENPDWWANVQQAYENREKQSAVDPNNPFAQEFNALKAELNETKQFINELKNKEVTQERQGQDKQLDGEIKTMRENYSHLDWSTVDENGYDLETRVLAFANEKGIKHFDVAFKAFNHDRLLSLAEERGKEAVAKDIQKKTKLGLLGSQAPKRELTQATDVKNKSYDNLLNEALEEIGYVS